VSDYSDPNHRPINVITFLAARPTEAFTLAELARHLGLSKGSAHRVMTALAQTGFVSRHPRHKTYSLGVVLVAIGQAALERHRGIDCARREMARLAAELNVGCGATAMVNNEYLLLAREGVPQTYDGLTLVGERRFVVPPIGVGQLAWRSPPEVEAYLASGATYMSDGVRRHMLAAFPEIRRRGYAMAANGEAMRKLMEATVVPVGQWPDEIPALPSLEGQAEIPPEEFQLLTLADARGVGVNYLAAPVFSPEGDISFEMLMSGLPVDLTEAEFDRYAARLKLAADTVTKEIRGRKPDLW
jgi:DNA-binding IclR family transcriptional regulator